MPPRLLSLLPGCVHLSFHTGPRAPTLCSVWALRARYQFGRSGKHDVGHVGGDVTDAGAIGLYIVLRINFCFFFFFFFFFSERAARRGGGGALPDFFFLLFFPVQQTTSGIGHRVKYLVVFFGLATNALNVRNNNNNNNNNKYFACRAMFKEKSERA